MVEYRSYAYARLENYDVVDPAIGFYDELLAIGDDLMRLECDIAEHKIGPTGFRSYGPIQEFEERYIELVNDIRQAHEAVVTGTPWELDRFDETFGRDKNDFLKLQGKYAAQVAELEKASGRVSKLLDSKRSAIHSRAIATFSAAAVSVSATTLVVNALL